MSDENRRNKVGRGGDRSQGMLEKAVATAVRRAVRAQSGTARKYVERLRAAHPSETPAALRARLDSRYLNLATASGTAVGAAGAVPGVGTVVALGAAGAESAVFLEATAFYTMAVATVHGVDVTDVEHEELLVMTILLGASGTALLSRTLGADAGAGSASLARGASRLPSVSDLNRRLVSRMVRRFATKRATLVLGKLAPAGIGAAVGGWGNRKLAGSVIDTAHATFGAPPAAWPA